MFFEWDPAKAAANYAKHRVAFDVAMKVFDDAAVHYVDASVPWDDEPRETAVGFVRGELLAVVHVMRAGDVCRLISARPATPEEGRSYANR